VHPEAHPVGVDIGVEHEVVVVVAAVLVAERDRLG